MKSLSEMKRVAVQDPIKFAYEYDKMKKRMLVLENILNKAEDVITSNPVTISRHKHQFLENRYQDYCDAKKLLGDK